MRALDRKKTRMETGWFLAEGARLVQQGLDRGWRAEAVVAAQDAISRQHINAILETAKLSGARIVAASERVLAQISRKDNPQTVLAAFHQRDLALETLADRLGDWIALYEVRDPGNLGTILRTADCAGAAGVVLVGTCCDPYSVEAVRASMGSVFDMPFVATDFARFDGWRRDRGLPMIAASVNGRTRHDQADYGAASVILMGNEQAGLPPEIEAACDTLALIPMRGGADSLNLAQATALMTYEAWRARGFQGSRNA